MTLDASQNVGVGVTPSSWGSGRPALEFGGATQPAIAFNGNATNGGSIWTNSYFSGSANVYKATGYATRFDTSNSGAFGWFQSQTSGTAGATFSFVQAMTLDASGNLGLGLTPSAWPSSLSGTIENLSGGLYPYHPGGGTYDIGIFVNAYYDGSWRYKNTGSASGRYIIGVGTTATSAVHVWGIAGTGTAGNAISFTQAMTLDGSGNFLLAGTSARQRLTIGSTSVVSTSTPEAIDLGGTYSNTAGQNLKIYTFNDGSTKHGIGVSTGSSDYVTPTGGRHTFYVNTSEVARIDPTGNVTKPSNSCFLVFRSSPQDPYVAGSALVYNSEVFDQNNNFNPSTGIFTAPVTGRYLFSATVLVQNSSVGAEYDLQLKTSNRYYYGSPGRIEYQTTGVSWGDGYISMQVTQIADMDANDTAYITFTTFGAGYIYGGDGWTRFSGCLIS
jgi:hypothetical protein